MGDYKYKFSIVTAVYNVELFLRETLDSIVGQDIGFRNIQLILVDDGSSDDSGKICDEYAAKYPDNIFVIHKENGGVSSARNAGLELVTGKYVNFIDADDKWESDALRKVWKFFEKHYDETDVVSVPLIFFDGMTGGHSLNKKFAEGSRIADLNENVECVQLSMSSAFVKCELLKGLAFDTRLSYAEDAQLLQKILLKKQTLGLLAEVKYMYRRRSSGPNSAIQNSRATQQWYLPYMEYFQLETLKYAEEQCGEVPRFIQYTLMYDLQWRIKQQYLSDDDVISDEEKQKYLECIKKILKYIDDDIISAQRHLSGEQKVFAFEMKYEKYPEIVKAEKDVFCAFSDETRFSLANSRVKIEFFEIEKNLIKIEGSVGIYNVPFENLELSLWFNNEKIETTVTLRDNSTFCLDNEVLKRYGFTAEIPLEPGTEFNKIRLGAYINGKLLFLQKYSYGYFCPLFYTYRFSHYTKDGWVAVAKKNSVNIVPANFKNSFLRETKFLLWLFKNNKNKSRSQMFLRLWYTIRSRFNKKPIWLISDRRKVAGDNGEAFFRYMCAEHPEIDARFVIDKDCPDYDRIKKIGPVIAKESRKHKLYVLLSEYIISSHGENEHFDPFGNSRNVFKDIMANKPFVFLQHGVIKDDLSGWLTKYNKNIFGFITSAKAEYDSIIEYNYNYTEKEVWLTGLPRFDRLYDNEQKIITVMPTWRKYLTNGTDPQTGEWRLIEDFKQSDFFVFYNSLFNDKRLMSKMKEKGYKIKFLLHPNLRAAAELFESNDLVELISGNISYTDMYAVSSLIVTDYSSAIFDFVYLRKPIIYTHFDFSAFVSGAHTYVEGYFDYTRDGFGEVEYDLDSTVDRIIEYMEDGCKLKDKYRERIDNFFAFDDQNNCKRVYEKIIESRKR